MIRPGFEGSNSRQSGAQSAGAERGELRSTTIEPAERSVAYRIAGGGGEATAGSASRTSSRHAEVLSISRPKIRGDGKVHHTTEVLRDTEHAVDSKKRIDERPDQHDVKVRPKASAERRAGRVQVRDESVDRCRKPVVRPNLPNVARFAQMEKVQQSAADLSRSSQRRRADGNQCKTGVRSDGEDRQM